jgi:hypothetical protein
MSDEHHEGEEPEVEAHTRGAMNAEPADESEENEVEAHVRKANVRMD